MNVSLKGMYALVAGSSRGIGRAIAESFAAAGANVTLVARSVDTLSEVRENLDRSKGQDHDYISVDFTNLQDVKKRIRASVLQNPYDILINNTGGPPGGKIQDAAVDEFETAFRQHLMCNHIITGLLIPGMKKRGYGRIINIISTSVKQPLPNLGVSNTIRGAVANWSKTMANELGEYGITVNNILPGATNTDRLVSIIENKANKSGKSHEEVATSMKNIIPAGRFAEPEEVAYAATFLASNLAGYISGINLPVDGGRTKSL